MEKNDLKNVICVALITKKEEGLVNYLLVREKNGVLDFPGGKVKEHESLHETVKREILEEIGLRLTGKIEIQYIGYIAILGDGGRTVEDSKIIYYMMIENEIEWNGLKKENIIWVHSNSIEEHAEYIPYDNYLIIKNGGKVETNIPHIVPGRFCDAPKSKERVAIRYFFEKRK